MNNENKTLKLMITEVNDYSYFDCRSFQNYKTGVR